MTIVSLFKDNSEASGPVECLGSMFPSEHARREHFPHRIDESILALSDPAHYDDAITPKLVSAVQEALSGLQRVAVTADGIEMAILAGESQATPENLRRRFESFLAGRCRAKDASKLRFAVDLRRP